MSLRITDSSKYSAGGKLPYQKKVFAKLIGGLCVSDNYKIASLSNVSSDSVVVVTVGHPLVPFGKEDRHVISFRGLYKASCLRYEEF